MNLSARSGCVVKMKILFIVMIALVLCMCSSFKYRQEGKCDELGGECVSLYNCDVLKQLIHKPSNVREIVRKRTCGFDKNVPRVCCPQPESNKCLTLEGTLGTCVDLNNCSNLLKRMYSQRKEDIEYIHRSRCAGPVHYSVCCDLRLDVINVLISNGEPENRYKTECPSSNKKLGLISLDKASNNECCGVEESSRNKIIGGTKTAIDEYPWLAMLEYKQPYLCGGTLISSLYVLTAAHCLVGDGMKPKGVKSVRLGEYNTTNAGKDCVEVEGDGEDCTDGEVTMTISKIIVHPKYQRVKNIKDANDIGLLRLSKLAPYTEFIRPICLPSTDVTKMATSSDLRLHVAGWGKINDFIQSSAVKLKVDLPILKQKKCEKLYSFNGQSLIWDKQFCAGGEPDKDACKGDSGGPLIYSDINSETHQIVGITSFGSIKCGLQNVTSVFTKVFDYLPWILATTSGTKLEI